MLLKSTIVISILLAVAFLLPLTSDNTVEARICMTPDSPLGSIAKNFLNIPIIKQGIPKKMAENPDNKTFLKVINEASKNMTSLLCKPGEVATILMQVLLPISQHRIAQQTRPVESNSTLANNISTTAVQPPQIKKNDSFV